MTTPSLAQLLSIPSASDFRAQILSQLSTLGFPVTSWEPDGVANNLVEVFAQMLSVQSQVAYPMAAGGFLDTAAALKNPDGTDNQDWLALLAANVYGVTPLPATVATGAVTVTNNTATPFVLSAGDLRLSNQSGYTYTSTASATVPAYSYISVPIQADQPGSTGTALANTLTLVSPVVGITATNPLNLVGKDGESNAALAERCRERLATLSPNGSAAAYDYFLRTANDGAGSLGITRTYVMPAAGTGQVQLYAQNAANTLTNASPEITLAAAYIAATCTPDTVTPVLQAAPIVSISIEANYTTPPHVGAIAPAILSAAVSDYFASLPIGGLPAPGDPTFVVPRSGIIAAIQDVAGVAGVQLVTPAADVPMYVLGAPCVPSLGFSLFTRV